MTSFEESVRAAVSAAVSEGRRLSARRPDDGRLDWRLGERPVCLFLQVKAVCYEPLLSGNATWAWGARAGWPKSGTPGFGEWEEVTGWMPLDDAVRDLESRGVPAFCEAARLQALSLLRAGVDVGSMARELAVMDVLTA